MTTKDIMLTLALGLTLGAPLAAQESAAPMSPTPVAAEHPACAWNEYPRWSKLTPKQVLGDMRYGLQRAQQRIDAICAVEPDKATFENVFLAHQDLGLEMSYAEGALSVLESNLDSPEVRAVLEELIPEVTAFTSSIIANEKLWAVVKSAAAQDWVKTLSPAKQRYVQQVVDSFRESGADLSPEQKARKAQIMERLSTLTHEFSKKVLDSQNAWQLVVTDKAQLDGMSDAWMAKAAAAALEKGHGTKEAPQWLVTLDIDSVIEVLRNCSVPATRKACWEGRQSVGTGEYDTAAIVAEVMQLRKELAELLGFKTYADLTTAHRMVESGDKAMAFVDDLAKQVLPAFGKECQELLDFYARQTGKKVEKMDPWDTTYYAYQLKKQRYSFDPDSVRPYFEGEQVRQGMFNLAAKLYGINFKEVPTVCLKPGEELPAGTAEVWYPGVRLFEVRDNKTGAHLGSFYIDLYPRPSKRAGAWVMPLAFGESAANGKPHRPHLAVLSGNLTAATGDMPALYSHYDVETIFHEFGHMMHCMLTDTELTAHAGTNVSWDFVELPSQLNENWTWEPEALATYAKHYKTGEPMPAELVEKLNNSRFYMPASDEMSQLALTKLDLEMHMNYDKLFKGRDLDEASNALVGAWRMPSTVPSRSVMRNLTHCICGGYAAGYYSYKWAEVLAADAFSRFAKEGVLNPATGAAYREAILSKGDSKPAAEVFRDFMGRDPQPDALLKKEGLK